MQENSHVVLVDLCTGLVAADFLAGAADRAQIDTLEKDLIELNRGLSDVPREPDGVTWLSDSQ